MASVMSDHVRRTPEDVRTQTDDAVWCLECGDYLALDGTPLQVAEDAAWFRARHERCESRKAKR